MQAPEPLLQRLQHTPGMEQGRRLVLLLTQLGDFDSMEYAQALVPVLPQLEAAGIRLRAIAIGDAAGADRFCSYTGFPREAPGQAMPSPDCTGSWACMRACRRPVGRGPDCC